MSPAAKVRVYLPCTLPRLAAAVASGALGPAPLAAHAVTAALREAWPEAGEEEWEYAATTAAALAALDLLHPGDRPCRVVVAADVPELAPLPEQAAGEEPEPTVVGVPQPVPWRAVAAVLVDDPAAAGDVAAAVAARDSRDPRVGADQTAEEATYAAAVERCLDHDLGWYAVQEVPALLAGAGAGPR